MSEHLINNSEQFFKFSVSIISIFVNAFVKIALCIQIRIDTTCHLAFLLDKS